MNDTLQVVGKGKSEDGADSITFQVRPPLTKEEKQLRKLHDKVCQSCDGCSKSRCAFTDGYSRGQREANESKATTTLELDLITILLRNAGERGDNEGAVETLERIIREREILLRNGIKEKLLKLL